MSTSSESEVAGMLAVEARLSTGEVEEAVAVCGAEWIGDSTVLDLRGADGIMEEDFFAAEPRPGGFVGDRDLEFMLEGVVGCFGLRDEVGAFGTT
jgi:hypothetical protein